MSFDAMAWALRQTLDSGTDKFVLVALADHHNQKTGQCNPSIARLAEETCFSEVTVRRSLGRLVDRRLVERVRNRNADGSLAGYEYILTAYLADLSDQHQRSERSVGLPIRESAQEPGTSRPEPGGVTSLRSVTPSRVLIDGRDLPFDALSEECAVGERSPRAKEVAVALAGSRGSPGIREQAWRQVVELADVVEPPDAETFERMLAAEIRRRAVTYRQKMPGATLSPTALAKWWTDLPSLPPARTGRAQGSSREGAIVAEAAIRRARGQS